MDIVFTNKCKDKIIHAKDGIKFALKGYAFYTENLKQTTDELKNLVLSDLDETKIVLNEYKDGTEIPNRLFDMTYIPSLEGKVTSTEKDEPDELVCQFGTYDIVINKGLFKTLPDPINYILVFGEELSENATNLGSRKKYYIAAIIKPDTTIEITENNFNPLKIIFQVSLSDITVKTANAQIVIDDSFDELTENEAINNLNFLALQDNLTLTPNEKNNDYSSDVEYIKYDTRAGESGPANTKFFPGNIGLLDKTEKINNNWNLKPRVFVGQKKPNEVTLPHIQFLNGDNTDLNSFSFTYDTKNGYFSMNQDDGIDNIQANILPEDVDEENTICLKDKIKRFNSTFDYADVSACQSHFRFNSNKSKYGNGAYHIFELDNHGTEIASNELPTEYITLIYSDYNKFLGENEEALVLDSDNNLIGNGINDLTMVNTFNSILENTNRYYKPDDYLGTTRDVLNGNILLGASGINSKVTTPFTANNITFIGNNTNSTYAPYTPHYMIETDRIKTVKGVFTRHYKSDNTDVTAAINDTLNIDIMSADYNGEQLIENQALIGFNGLTVNKIPSKEYFFTEQYQIGYSKELNDYDYYYYGQSTEQENRNFSVVFGNYNANDNLSSFSAVENLSVSAAFALKGRYGNFDTKFSSFYNNDFTYTTDMDEYDECSAYANVHKLFFKHTQDSMYTPETMSGEWNKITADEGDYGFNRIVVVGDGKQLTENNITGHSPAEFASKYTSYSDDCRRKNLFSIEKNSLQLVHNGAYDDNPHYSATNVENIPSMFAVRGSDPVTQTYTYHFISGTSGTNNTTFVNKELYESINQYNLHHSVYTPTGIFIPLQRSSNDLYKMNFKNVKGLINDNVIKTNKEVSYDELKSKMHFKQTSFILTTKGLTFKYLNGTAVKGTNVTKGMNGSNVNYTYETKYNFDMKDLVNWYALNQDTFIPMSDLNGNDTQLYTFYIINNNPYKGLNFKGFRMNKNGNSVQTLYKNKYIPKGRCLRVDYMDCATNGKYGVMNFDYWDKTRNSFYK